MIDQQTRETFLRTIAVIGEEAFLRLQDAKVVVFGIGGVGAACAEALVRSGVGELLLVDPDHVSQSNLNRQLIALHSTLGQNKARVCKERMLDINPRAKISFAPVFLNRESAGQFNLGQFNAAADCVDTLQAKLLLAKMAPDSACYLVSCLGMGNRLDPGKLVFSDIYETKGCPLARRMRKACKEQAIPSLRVLSSLEEPVNVITETIHGRHAPGSVAFVPPVAGMMMAGDIIMHLISQK